MLKITPNHKFRCDFYFQGKGFFDILHNSKRPTAAHLKGRRPFKQPRARGLRPLAAPPNRANALRDAAKSA